MDLLLLLVLMTAPIWATVLFYANPLRGVVGATIALPLVLIGTVGALLDAWLLAGRIVGEDWW